MLTRRNPSADLFPVAVLERFFNDPFFGEAPAIARLEEGTLPLDVSEDETHVIVRASLPGFARENIDVEAHDNILSISAKLEEVNESRTERFYRKERRVGSVSRRIALPAAVVEKDAAAEFKDGVLTLRLPKIPQEQPRKIRIG